MPAVPPDDSRVPGPGEGTEGSGSDLARFAEDSLTPGMAVGQSQLYLTAVMTDGKSRSRRLSLGAWLAIGWLGVIVALAVLAQLGLLPLKDPNQSFTSCARLGPFAKEGSASGHLLGCDSNGRDMMSRLIFGAWSSILVSTGAVALGFVVGGVLGMLAGYFGGKVDTVLTSVFNVFLSIPGVILALALVAFLQGAADNTGGQHGIDPKFILVLALGIVSIPLLGRITRASALTWSQREFVTAARAQGAKPLRIMLREVLPNVLPAMLSIALLGIAVAMVAEGTLSILGVGVKPPTPSWGNIIGSERSSLADSPHMIFEPALCIFFTVLSLNFLGDVVRARLDVRESSV
ncbi:MAG: ABC transporter permease [Actinomycetes bacterium]